MENALCFWCSLNISTLLDLIFWRKIGVHYRYISIISQNLHSFEHEILQSSSKNILVGYPTLLTIACTIYLLITSIYKYIYYTTDCVTHSCIQILGHFQFSYSLEIWHTCSSYRVTYGKSRKTLLFLNFKPSKTENILRRWAFCTAQYIRISPIKPIKFQPL